MPVDNQQIMDEAEKLGRLVAQHPAIARHKAAEKAVTDDPDANRLMGDFERHYEQLARQEQAGMPITDAQRMQLESLQGRIVSHIKIKNLNAARVDFIDLLRKVTQTIQRQVMEGGGAGGGGAPGAPTGPRLATGAAGGGGPAAPAGGASPASPIITE